MEAPASILKRGEDGKQVSDPVAWPWLSLDAPPWKALVHLVPLKSRVAVTTNLNGQKLPKESIQAQSHGQAMDVIYNTRLVNVVDIHLFAHADCVCTNRLLSFGVLYCHKPFCSSTTFIYWLFPHICLESNLLLSRSPKHVQVCIFLVSFSMGPHHLFKLNTVHTCGFSNFSRPTMYRNNQGLSMKSNNQ